jgi:hypothetical protein
MGWGGPHELVRQRSTYEKIDSSGSWYGLCESGWGLSVNVWGAESHPQLSHAPVLQGRSIISPSCPGVIHPYAHVGGKYSVGCWCYASQIYHPGPTASSVPSVISPPIPPQITPFGLTWTHRDPHHARYPFSFPIQVSDLGAAILHHG